jgi:hypothetical protein
VTVGLIAAHANALLNVYRNTAVSAIANVYVQLHTADPGAAGTTAVSAVTTRNEITWNAASAGSMTILALSPYSMTATETITHVSFWSATSAGTCYRTAALTSGVPVINGSSFDLTTCTFSYTPIAA